VASVLSYGFAAFFPERWMQLGPTPGSLITEALGFGSIAYIAFRWLLPRLARWGRSRSRRGAFAVKWKVKLVCIGLWALVQGVIAPASVGDPPPAHQAVHRPSPSAGIQVHPELQVRQVQTLLGQLSYNLGPVDGLMGPKTHRALQQYAQDRGMELPNQRLAVLALLSREAQRQRP
jgi:hypothetical protein